MIDQTNPPNQQVANTKQKTRATRPVRWRVFYAFIAVAVLAVVIEQILFPNLRDNASFLVLLTFTTLFSIIAIGLSVSGLRSLMSRPLKIGVSVVVWGFALLDVFFLILPSVLPGPTANDAKVSFVGGSNAAVTTTPNLTITDSAATTAAPVIVASTTDPVTTSATTAPLAPTIVATTTDPATTDVVAATTNPATIVAVATTNGVVAQVTTAAATVAPTIAVAAPKTTVIATAAPTSAVAKISTLGGTFNNQGVEPVAGNVTLGRTTDGKTLLRFENLKSTNGPDLYVYLSKNATPTTNGQVKNGIEVGKLKAILGNSNYELDASLDLSQYKSVVVYCKSFSAIFGYANLVVK